MSHPLNALAAAEATLIASIDAAAERLNAVGTNGINAALARLQAAALAASQRMAEASKGVEQIVGQVVSDIYAQAGHIPVEPAIVTTPAPDQVEPLVEDLGEVDLSRPAEASAEPTASEAGWTEEGEGEQVIVSASLPAEDLADDGLTADERERIAEAKRFILDRPQQPARPRGRKRSSTHGSNGSH